MKRTEVVDGSTGSLYHTDEEFDTNSQKGSPVQKSLTKVDVCYETMVMVVTARKRSLTICNINIFPPLVTYKNWNGMPLSQIPLLTFDCQPMAGPQRYHFGWVKYFFPLTIFDETKGEG